MMKTYVFFEGLVTEHPRWPGTSNLSEGTVLYQPEDKGAPWVQIDRTTAQARGMSREWLNLPTSKVPPEYRLMALLLT